MRYIYLNGCTYLLYSYTVCALPLCHCFSCPSIQCILSLVFATFSLTSHYIPAFQFTVLPRGLAVPGFCLSTMFTLSCAIFKLLFLIPLVFRIRFCFTYSVIKRSDSRFKTMALMLRSAVLQK